MLPAELRGAGHLRGRNHTLHLRRELPAGHAERAESAHSYILQVFRACLARLKLVPVQEDWRRREKMQIKEEREKEKRQEEEKGGSRQ